MKVARHLLPVSAIGLLATGACFILHTSAMSPFFVGMAIMPIPVVMPAGSRLSISGPDVLLHGRSVYGNPFVWWTLIFLIGGLSVVLQMILDPWQSWRLAIVAILSLVGSCVFGFAFFSNRGVVSLNAESITVRDGVRFPLVETAVWLFMRDNKSPQVALKHTSKSDPSILVRTIPPIAIGIDVNTLLSAITQIQAWKKAGIDATPEQIVEMLRLTPPKGVEVGKSVEIPI